MPYLGNGITLSIITPEGFKLKEYRDDNNNCFVEGVVGDNYELLIHSELRRVLVVPSVDGLNVLSHKSAARQDVGYILKAYSKLIVPGWAYQYKKITKFVFFDKTKSHKSQNKQIGVIGCAFYIERNVLIPDRFLSRVASKAAIFISSDSFDRGEIIADGRIFYTHREELEKMGIVVESAPTTYLPNPFPVDGLQVGKEVHE
ncbi:MAG: hypothetical protein VSS75_008085 [Candidatus Parabeggiatoa sp.]|nr:hypothetical protein [Candidatus Parabeggiatoa sp.]